MSSRIYRVFLLHHGGDGILDVMRWVVAQGVLHGVLFVLLKGFGEGGSIIVLLIDHTVDLPIAEEIENVGHQVAVEIGAFLLARLVNHDFHLTEVKDVFPNLHVVALGLVGEQRTYSAHVVEDFGADGSAVGFFFWLTFIKCRVES